MSRGLYQLSYPGSDREDDCRPGLLRQKYPSSLQEDPAPQPFTHTRARNRATTSVVVMVLASFDVLTALGASYGHGSPFLPFLYPGELRGSHVGCPTGLEPASSWATARRVDHFSFGHSAPRRVRTCDLPRVERTLCQLS